MLFMLVINTIDRGVALDTRPPEALTYDILINDHRKKEVPQANRKAIYITALET